MHVIIEGIVCFESLLQLSYLSVFYVSILPEVNLSSELFLVFMELAEVSTCEMDNPGKCCSKKVFVEFPAVFSSVHVSTYVSAIL